MLNKPCAANALPVTRWRASLRIDGVHYDTARSARIHPQFGLAIRGQLGHPWAVRHPFILRRRSWASLKLQGLNPSDGFDDIFARIEGA
jgi:hypothetical protein